MDDVVSVLRERAQTLDEMADKSEYFFSDFEEYDAKAAQKHLRPVVRNMLADVRSRLSMVEPWSPDLIHAQVMATVEDHDVKLGKLAQPLRVAVSGAAATPPIDETLLLVGKARTVDRIDRALEFIDRRMAENA